jgi:hypothetical protein
MLVHYGELEGVKGADGDALDVFVGPDAGSPLALVVHTQDPATGRYDEDKVMLGFGDWAEGLDAFVSHYDQPDFYESHHSMPVSALLRWCAKNANSGRKVTSGRPGNAANAVHVQAAMDRSLEAASSLAAGRRTV